MLKAADKFETGIAKIETIADTTNTSIGQIEESIKCTTYKKWCNPAAATGQALDSPVTIDGVEYNTDTAEYRKAKFKSEAGNHFEMNSVLYHYLFTLFFSMVDNRAKNTFWAYNKATSKWNLVHSYDHDTALGIDNEGGNTLRAGYLDTDMIGTKAVFNAYDYHIRRSSSIPLSINEDMNNCSSELLTLAE